MTKCNQPYCNNKHYAKGLCKKHYAQFKKHGQVLLRTRFDANNIFDNGSYYSISLYNIKGVEIACAKIDKDNCDIIKDYKWRLDCHGYVITGRKVIIYLHNLIINKDKNERIVFINGNKLDNRRANLKYKEYMVENKQVKDVDIDDVDLLINTQNINK